MKINEIFYSLQGEGHWTGTPAIFIRFAGCNLRCGFCDTNHESGEEYDAEELIKELSQYPAKRVILTGGEPGLQVNDELIEILHREGYKVHIETNGTVKLPVAIDWVTCSPKSLHQKTGRIDELKVVAGESAVSFENLGKFGEIEAGEYYLQPCDTGSDETNAENLEKCVEYILGHPQWRLSLQTHKMINIR